MSFYTTFERLCDEKGITPVQVRSALNISQSTMASWKARGLTPKYDTTKRIAAYLGVEVDDLLTEKEHAVSIIDHVLDSLERIQSPKVRIDAALNLLNPDGQQKAVERVVELTEIPRYRAKTAPESSPAPQEGKDTTPPPDAPETAPEGK